MNANGGIVEGHFEHETLGRHDDLPIYAKAPNTGIGELVAALAEAQREFEPVLKDTDNPYYKSKYADLSSVIAATQPGLSNHGLVVIQIPISDTESKRAGVSTILAHKSGQYIERHFMLPAVMAGRDGTVRFDAQSVGSAITYARRYSYQAIIGVAAEVDDDGSLASGLGTKEAAAKVAKDKIAKAQAEQESIEFTPNDAGMLKLSGHGLAIMRAEEKEALDKLMMTWLDVSKCWAIPEQSINAFVNLCSKHKVSVKQADSSQSPVPQGAGVAGRTAPPGAEHISAAPGYFPITSLVTKKVKADKTGSDKMLVVEWNGAPHSIATWFFPSMNPLLTECYVNHTPIKLVLGQSGKYSNVVSIEGAEKGDDGVWRFPIQNEPPLPEEYEPVDDDIPENMR